MFRYTVKIEPFSGGEKILKRKNLVSDLFHLAKTDQLDAVSRQDAIIQVLPKTW